MNPIHVLAHLQWSNYQLEYGIRSYAREADWTLSFMRNVHDYPNGSKRVDGLLLLPGPVKSNFRKLYPNAKIVNISDVDKYIGDAWVGSDHRQIARMAADYLRSLGHTNFITFLHKNIPPLSYRADSFRQILADAGIPCPLIQTDIWNEQIVINPEHLKQRLRKVFKSMEFPLAVFCPDDTCAESFIHVALDLGYKIPEQIAVLGVNNSRDICDMCRVPLSSIDLNMSRRGYESARILDILMKNLPLENSHIVIPPLSIVKRASTEMLVQTDKVVTAIQEYIREHFAEKISMETVLQDMQLSRSSAFARFTRNVGHSIGKEITIVRMNHACYLLKDTNYKIDYVARMSGYQNTSSFCRIFKKMYNQTPADYREHNAPPAVS